MDKIPVTLLRVNDLQKYNTNKSTTFQVLICCRCKSSCRCRCLWEEGSEVMRWDDRWSLYSLFTTTATVRRRRRWTIATPTSPTTDGQRHGAITTKVTYLDIIKGVSSSHHQQWIFEKSRTRFQGQKASKNKEKEMGRAGGQCCSWNFGLDSQFPPEVANVEQGR